MKATLIRPLRLATVLLALMGAVVPVAPAQTETDPFIAGYTDFPNHLRVHSIYDEARAAQNG